MKKYCEKCGKKVETIVILKKETYKVLGEDIDVEARVLVCPECHNEFYCEELDNATLTNAYNKYRKRHKLLLPSEIKQIRELYGLSQRSFAKLLNWGDKTINRYENGSIQDSAHNSLLLFLRNPENMKSYLLENENSLDEKQESKLLEVVNKLISENEKECSDKFFEIYISSEPSIDNGFKSFDYEKFAAMVVFFAIKGTDLLKTKLMKLLNYSDMLFYKENCVSISGLKYVHLQYGPVPEKFDVLLGKLEEDKIAHIEVEFFGKYERHKVVPDERTIIEELTDKEIKVLERVYNKFIDFGSVEISNYSHKEMGYSSTLQGEIISYSYASDIELN
ncbi:MAG: type II TA system antitoxin MqsA family protein [Intestinibacter bartlettii]|uniref:type II TA system antitoxin MqsA family protein n=1 Tax=Bacillota TaxID=1239 RepID=UPI000319DC85|nr:MULTISPECIES: type II TA system antitoxin MqsA family protein [Anaerococcus]MDU0946243.1 DUF4065 domain-containing protein [Anaerococcus vaginalis]MDU1031208.1 DUF4065 domain-containing protein [Anaerococcus vaginalis]